MKHVHSENVLYHIQHSFRSRLSCETQLIQLFADDTLMYIALKLTSNAIVLHDDMDKLGLVGIPSNQHLVPVKIINTP